MALLLIGTAGYFAWFGRWSFYRLVFSVWDLLLAVLKYILTLFFIRTDWIPEAITTIPDVPFVPFLPIEREELSGFWGRFWALFSDGDHFLAYCRSAGDVFLKVYRLFLPIFCLIICLKSRLSDSAEDENDDFGKKSRAVCRAEKILARISPVFAWIRDFFLGLPFWYVLTLALISLAGTNLITVTVDTVAGLLYYSVSTPETLYTQIYKLFLDLTVGWASLPLPVWLVVFYVLFCILRRIFAFDRLRRMEEKVRDFISTLPLCVLITGKIGIGKTKANVNLSLTMQDLMRDRMRETMFGIQAEYPEYPWEYLDRQIGVMFAAGDLPSKDRTRQIFDELVRGEDLIYGYTGRLTFEDGVVRTYLPDRIVDYAELEYMYRVQCLISSSYSLRTDAVYTDLGKMPLWQTEYFETPAFDPRGEIFRSHILDFDTLRLGRTVDPASPAGAWEFGVLSHTEMGKDFGNALTNKDIKASDRSANIKNDMLIDRIKVLRHSSTACHIPYCQYFGDEQRPTSLGADALELCDVLRLTGSSAPRTTLHLLLIERFCCDWLLSVWNTWYSKRRTFRADTDLPTWILRKLVDRVYPWYQEKMQRFGYQEINAQVLDGADVDAAEVPTVKLYSCFKKVHAGRYSTDCFRAVLATRTTDAWSFDRSPTYSGEVATPEEIHAQHSYFGNKLLAIMREPEEDDE